MEEKYNWLVVLISNKEWQVKQVLLDIEQMHKVAKYIARMHKGTIKVWHVPFKSLTINNEKKSNKKIKWALLL